ncbi:hypothetical protein [Vacuolonema iberomarrocanum]|uniref:hypothetical protein n=1 Tax=Vacuolonema iberomarrocanum TaxID=3454632 RepID=UPI003F6DAAE1
MLSRSLHTALRAMQHRAQGGFAASVARFVVGRSGVVVVPVGFPIVGMHRTGKSLGMALGESLGMAASNTVLFGGSHVIRFSSNRLRSGNLVGLKSITGTVIERFELCLPTPVQQWLNPDYVQPKSGRFRTSPTSP